MKSIRYDYNDNNVFMATIESIVDEIQNHWDKTDFIIIFFSFLEDWAKKLAPKIAEGNPYFTLEEDNFVYHHRLFDLTVYPKLKSFVFKLKF